MIAEGSAKANRARDEATQRVASSWCIRGPIEGNPASSIFVFGNRPGVFLHAPLCGLAPSYLVFLPGITQERCLKPPGPNLMLGGISPCAILWRGVHPCWLSPPNGDLGSTQILTRQCGAKSQSVSQLTNSGTAPTRKSRHFLTTRMEPLGFIMLLTQNKAVHMELSFCQSFQLKQSLGGYMMGTTMGFPTRTVEALAPRSRHRMPWMHPQ
jgi:hypothetical protein